MGFGTHGNHMVKIYKYNNKLAVYLPFDVVKALKLSENDEIDFFRMNENVFIFAKKADITPLLLGNTQLRTTAPVQQSPSADLSEGEISVLKKLDTLRYQQRTQDNVDKILNTEEKSTLSQLLKKRAVSVFGPDKGGQKIYSISKGVYDRFLMRKRPQASAVATPQQQAENFLPPSGMTAGLEDENVKKLETDGFIVLQTEAEASHVSSLLEDSIKHGQVFGTRAFNRKFYILLRSFLEKNSGQVLKELRGGDKRVSELVEKTGLPEGGVRAILYFLAEAGDVIEKKRDVFRQT